MTHGGLHSSRYGRETPAPQRESADYYPEVTSGTIRRQPPLCKGVRAPMSTKIQPTTRSSDHRARRAPRAARCGPTPSATATGSSTPPATRSASAVRRVARGDRPARRRRHRHPVPPLPDPPRAARRDVPRERRRAVRERTRAVRVRDSPPTRSSAGFTRELQHAMTYQSLAASLMISELGDGPGRRVRRADRVSRSCAPPPRRRSSGRRRPA